MHHGRKGPTWEASSSSRSVRVAATIRPVSASTPRWSFLQDRRLLRALRDASGGSFCSAWRSWETHRTTLVGHAEAFWPTTELSGSAGLPFGHEIAACAFHGPPPQFSEPLFP